MIQEHGQEYGIRALCEAFGEPRASWYRSQKPSVAPKERTPSPRSIREEEQRNILSILHSERFIDSAPAEIYTTLLDEGQYLCSVRSMYRILEEHQETVLRRQSAPRSYARPELLATRPNELWSWDITKLKGPRKWMYYYLYYILDVFSRYPVGWMVAHRESDALAEDLIAETCLKQGIERGQLTLHADRGPSMRSDKVAKLLDDLDVTKTHSRPYVSNDNPYSESGFKTLKYRPDFPDRFYSIEETRAFCQQFFQWCSAEHHHSGIAMLTPESVHYGKYPEILAARSLTLHRAYDEHPERFVKGIPKVEQLPQTVWINKPTEQTVTEVDVDHREAQGDEKCS